MPLRKTQGYTPVNANIQAMSDIEEDAGVVSGLDAEAGEIGEVKSTVVASGAAVALVTATSKTVASLVLPAGDWDILGVVNYIPAATTSITQMSEGSSLVDNTMGADDTFALMSQAALVPGAITQRRAIPVRRLNVSASTTVYLIANATFTVAALTAFGSIRARRVR